MEVSSHRLPYRPLESALPNHPEVGDRLEAEPTELLSRRRSHAPQGSYGARIEELLHLVGVYDEQPIGLAEPRCKLGEEFVGSDPNGAWKPEVLRGRLYLVRHLDGRAEELYRAGHVEEGLV